MEAFFCPTCPAFYFFLRASGGLQILSRFHNPECCRKNVAQKKESGRKVENKNKKKAANGDRTRDPWIKSPML